MIPLVVRDDRDGGIAPSIHHFASGCVNMPNDNDRTNHHQHQWNERENGQMVPGPDHFPKVSIVAIRSFTMTNQSIDGTCSIRWSSDDDRLIEVE